jgi:saccharopine dehydrogenase-like NADP-dependent oxidoreductase
MKILLIGAGAVSHVLSKLLVKDKSVSKIVCASVDIKRAKEFIDVRNKKIRLICLDASKKDQVIKAAKGVDVIINASLPNFNEIIMEAALAAKTNYIDLCSRLKDFKVADQLRFNSQFKKAKLLALINAGVAPGVTNLLAMDIADKLDSVSKIKIRLLEDQKASEFIPSWSVQVTLYDLSSPSLDYLNGKFRLLGSFKEFEDYEFPNPHGKKSTVNICGDEVATLPMFIKTKNIDFKSSGTDIEFLRVFDKMGLLSSKPIMVKNKKMVPLELFTKIAPKIPIPKEMKRIVKNKIIENAVFISVVEGEGIESGRKIRIKESVTYPDLKHIHKIMPGATYISYPTGVAVYAFLKVMPKIKEKGVLPPEALNHEIRKEILLELESNGIVVNEEFSKI